MSVSGILCRVLAILAMGLVTVTCLAQKTSISGVVLDSMSARPLPGATVVVRTATGNTVSNTTTGYIYEPNQVQFSVSFNLMKYNRKIVLPKSEIGEKKF